MIGFRHLFAALTLAVLCACDGNLAPNGAPSSDDKAGVSRESAEMHRYYSSLQADLLSRGLLRTDGGGPDTPYTDTMLAQNFERIAFYDEYARGAGLRRSTTGAVSLRRWPAAVRLKPEFGASVSPAQAAMDGNEVAAYAERLARATAHPINVANTRANFHVLFAGEDDRAWAVQRLQEIVPDANAATVALFRDLPRSIHCLVVAFSEVSDENSYEIAVALIRAEHPDLLRKSCIHEELAQGLGLANDSPRARPSIFNDDDEFALLTTHDEALLGMLYDPRLHPGITLEQARPIIRTLATERAGQIN